MVREQLKIQSPNGLDLRPAGMLVGEANKFKSHIMMYRDEYKMNCKSLMSLLAFPVGPEAEVVLECEGEDEEEALKHMTEFIKSLSR